MLGVQPETGGQTGQRLEQDQSKATPEASLDFRLELWSNPRSGGWDPRLDLRSLGYFRHKVGPEKLLFQKELRFTKVSPFDAPLFSKILN